MLEFKKYSSIENSFNREFMERIVAEMPTDLEYVVQEKVHGANTSFLCDGKNVRFAKRTSMLEADENFYDYSVPTPGGEELPMRRRLLSATPAGYGRRNWGLRRTRPCISTERILFDDVAAPFCTSSTVLTSMSSTRKVVGICL